jgi:hypothetical protein
VASENGHLDVVDFLIKYGVNINQADNVSIINVDDDKYDNYSIAGRMFFSLHCQSGRSS